ncbi:hypothetical protein [Deinococcus multiflagellatus]|uniref:Transposase n=1 Tax=Deinococcus multiflagellatus TaxID=1656887 RepID=A0ABW1ZJ93_9DEIO
MASALRSAAHYLQLYGRLLGAQVRSQATYRGRWCWTPWAPC